MARRLMSIAACLVLSIPTMQAVAVGQDETNQNPPGPTRIAPRGLARPQDHGVGRLVADHTFTDIAGHSGTLAGGAGNSAIVIAVRDVGCPLSKKLGPRIASIEQRFTPRGVRFVYLNAIEQDSNQSMAAEIDAFGFEGPYIADTGGRIASQLGVTSTTEVFVLDSARTLVYRGAIDDQYGIGYTRTEPRKHYLINVLEQLLAGDDVTQPAMTAPGCVLSFDEKPDADLASNLTYHNRISRIVQQHCLACHRSGGSSPFALETYEQVSGRAAMIRYVVREKLMPPWHADDAGGPWANDHSLSDTDREAVLSWIEAKCTEGDRVDAPLERTFANGWSFEPDMVLQLPTPTSIPAEGFVNYQYQYVQTNFGEDKWVQAVEFRPSAPAEVVHHALMFVEEPRSDDESRREFRSRWQGGVQGYFAGLVPGQGATIFPDGFAKKMPKDAWLKLQLHYTPNGIATEDRMLIAFKFADGPPKHEVITSSAFNTRFRIPPGADNHEVTAEARFPIDGVLLSFAPHMHLRGKAFRYELTTPDGETTRLIDIPRYDFNWQTNYRFLEPLRIPKGSVIKATAWFDNSEDNPANPDPSREVRFGEQTWDEMMIGYFEWYRDNQ